MLINLKVNGQKNPLSVNKKSLRLSLESDGVVVEKVNYEILTKEGEVLFVQNETKSRTQYFDGRGLNDRTEYIAKATATCSDGKTYTDICAFNTGISDGAFNGVWIENPKFDGSVSEFKVDFKISSPVKKAMLYVVGLGFYKSFVNGVVTDEYFYKPVMTDFDVRTGLDNVAYDEENFKNSKKKVSYGTFDVLDKLVVGDNGLSILLGTGWYYNKDKNVTDPDVSFSTPKLIFELHLETENGEMLIKSDENCLVKNTNRKSQMFYGDSIDFTKDEDEFVFAHNAKAPSGEMIASECEYDGIIEELTDYEKTFEDGKTVFDFRKNHSGGLNLKVKGKRGSKLTLKFYEVKTDGKLDHYTSSCGLYDYKTKEHLSDLFQQSELILSGGEDELYPLFHWDCYRYVSFECDGEYEILKISSLFISTAVKQDGDFSCSDEFLTNFYNVFILTQRDNMHCGVPSDCPHREKLAYTGDGQLACESTSYCLDTESFYRKWLDDIIDSQGANGWIPYSAPHIAGGGGNWWSNAVSVVPIKLYKHTGDKEVLKKAVPSAIRLLGFYNTLHEGDYIITGRAISWMLGDWLAPEVMQANAHMINTLAYYSLANDVCFMLGELGEDSLEYEELKVKIKNAINEKFFDEKTANYGSGIQGENVMPLLFNIVKEEHKERVWQNVKNHYKKRGHFDTGIVLTPMLLDLLTERGEHELALKLMTVDDAPSFKHMLKGETTICEHWLKGWPREDGEVSGSVSHCHPMYGSVIQWVVKNVAGLDLSALYKEEVVFKPKFIDAIKSATAEKQTAYGLIRTKYLATNGFEMKILLPKGLTGKLVMPFSVTATNENGESITGKLLTLNGGEYIINKA